MKTTGHSFAVLSIIGSVLLMLSISLKRVFDISFELQTFLLGIATGWIGAVFLLKIFLLAEESIEAKLKATQILDDMKSKLP